MLLGAGGMGINSLFVSSTTIINNFTGLGLNFSAVRDISKAIETNDRSKIQNTLGVFKKLLLLTAILGLVAVIAFSPVLSITTFGDNKYILSFIFLSLFVFFNTLSTGNASILRGVRDLRGYAKYSITGSAVSLLISFPLYYLFGIKAIVPALILSALVTYLFSLLYVSKVAKDGKKISFRKAISEGGNMIKLGITMMTTTLISSVAHYLINIFIGNYGNLDDLGFYFAGMSITNQSIGLIFAAIIIDYQPRLAAVSEDNGKVREMVNHQAEITLLISAPVLIFLMIVAPLAIPILLSKEFTVIIPFVRLLAFAMIFKSVSYSIGAISYAKGDRKVFFLLEGITTNAMFLISCILGYWINGLIGLGYAFILMQVVYMILINIVNNKLYEYTPSRILFRLFFSQLLLITVVFVSHLTSGSIYIYLISIPVLILSLILSFKYLDMMIGIRQYISKFLRRER